MNLPYATATSGNKALIEVQKILELIDELVAWCNDWPPGKILDMQQFQAMEIQLDSIKAKLLIYASTRRASQLLQP